MCAEARVAIVHEWLDAYAGSERVVEQLLHLFPTASLFTVADFLSEERRDFIQNKRAQTTFIQRLPAARKHFRSYLPLMPLAIEQHDLADYDLVLSSNHAVAKGVITGPDQLHISYVHSPIRYAWDLQHQYLREARLDKGVKTWLVRLALHYMRTWDARSANGVDRFIANSHYIARRIRKAYRREADVIYPPVAVQDFPLHADKEDFYLAASRMVPYKRMDVIVEAFARTPQRRLIVIGTGSEFDRLRAQAGPNVEFLGYATADALRDHMQRARALIFAAEEDFGIIPVEAMACGTPVIAFGRGGALETVRGLDHDSPTGVFFDRQLPENLLAALDNFEQEAVRFEPAAIRMHALTFSESRFREEICAYVEHALETFHQDMITPT